MKQLIYKILLSLAAVLALSASVVFFVLGKERHDKIECTGVRVTVKDSALNSFVTRKDVENYIEKGVGKVKGKTVADMDLAQMESIVTDKSAVLTCEAFVTPDGKLNLDVTQRTPKVRFQTADNGWYADADGFIFPLQKNYSSLIPVVDGAFPVCPPRGFKGMIEEDRGRDWTKNMVALVSYMEKTGWDKRITQIHVDKNGEIVLVPVVGNEKFLFGQPVALDEKFGKLEKYYRMIYPLGKGYLRVDLRFESQIVCSEKSKA